MHGQIPFEVEADGFGEGLELDFAEATVLRSSVELGKAAFKRHSQFRDPGVEIVVLHSSVVLPDNRSVDRLTGQQGVSRVGVVALVSQDRPNLGRNVLQSLSVRHGGWGDGHFRHDALLDVDGVVTLVAEPELVGTFRAVPSLLVGGEVADIPVVQSGFTLRQGSIALFPERGLRDNPGGVDEAKRVPNETARSELVVQGLKDPAQVLGTEPGAEPAEEAVVRRGVREVEAAEPLDR